MDEEKEIRLFGLMVGANGSVPLISVRKLGSILSHRIRVRSRTINNAILEAKAQSGSYWF